MKNLKIFTNNIDKLAVEQINELLIQKAFENCKIRIMPDVHTGAGCVIGFTGNLGDKVIPNIVGVDIGCGMLTVNLGNVELDLERLDKIIREYVPCGFSVHEGRIVRFPKLQDLKCYRSLKDSKRIERSLGTLGGGNHFIEIDIDDDNNKYLIIHTGSRNLGKQVATYYQDLADKNINYKQDEFRAKQEQLISLYKSMGRKKEIEADLKKLKQEYKTNFNIIPYDLAYLEGNDRLDYLNDMKICQHFAVLNRQLIKELIIDNYFGKNMANKFSSFETIHNYISFDDNIIRKGAIRALKDEIVLIPINMRDGCIIGRGLGNADWNNSAPHGAGRIMSRNEAKENLNLTDFEKSMQGIYSTSISIDTIDEAPMVYKPMDEIINNIKDTVEIVKIIKPIYNFKASEK